MISKVMHDTKDYDNVNKFHRSMISKGVIKYYKCSVSFKGFFAKKHIYFKETLNYILFKIFSIASYNFFPFF